MPDTAEPAQDSENVEAVPPSQSRKVIAPISKDMQPESDADQKDESTNGEPDNDTSAPAEDTGSSDDQIQSDGAAEVDALAEGAAAKKEAEKAAEEQQKREEAVQELITTKKYFVPLSHDSTKTSSNKTPLIVAVAAILVLVIGYALIDMGTVDLGFDVPVHVLKK